MRTVPSESARRRAGFSLVEVTLALLVAAGGLLTIFGVFPVALRQSQMSRSDMGETAFADSVLQTLGGNIRAIDDISVWNDPVKSMFPGEYRLKIIANITHPRAEAT